MILLNLNLIVAAPSGFRMTVTTRMKLIFIVAVVFPFKMGKLQVAAQDLDGLETECSLPPSTSLEEVLCTCNVGCSRVVGCKQDYDGLPGCRRRQEAIDECVRRGPGSCNGSGTYSLPTKTSFSVGQIRTTVSRNNPTDRSSDATDPEPLVSTGPITIATTTTPSPMNVSATIVDTLTGSTLSEASSWRTTNVAAMAGGCAAGLLLPAFVVFIILCVIPSCKSRRSKLSRSAQDDAEAGNSMLRDDTNVVQLPKDHVTRPPVAMWTERTHEGMSRT